MVHRVKGTHHLNEQSHKRQNPNHQGHKNVYVSFLMIPNFNRLAFPQIYGLTTGLSGIRSEESDKEFEM